MALNEDGRSVRYIANLLNIGKSNVHNALARYHQLDNTLEDQDQAENDLEMSAMKVF
jgi:hypothetical protein